MMKIEDLTANPNNPREIRTKAQRGLRTSLERYGDLSGITYNKRSGQLVCGHQRVDQLKSMGGVYRDGAIEVGSFKYAVRVVDWPASAEREASVAANNGEIQGSWSDQIGDFLKDIQAGMSADTFSDLQFDSLAESLKIDLAMPGEVEEPPVPDLPTDPITQPGDVWILGDHRLVCGDASAAANYPKTAALWLTDPPYNTDYVGKTKDALTIENDAMDDDAFRTFLVDTFAPAFEALSPGAAFYIWHAHNEGFNFQLAVRDCGEVYRQCLVWNKSSMVMGRQDYQWKHEACLYGWRRGGSHGWYANRKQTTVLDFDRPNASKEHPTMKPIALFAYQISNSCPPGGLVLDNFAGSGTALLACEQNGRKCHSIELDPRYCDVIVERWEGLTSGQAQKEN